MNEKAENVRKRRIFSHVKRMTVKRIESREALYDRSEPVKSGEHYTIHQLTA